MKTIFEIREVTLRRCAQSGGVIGLRQEPTVDACARKADAAVRCVRLNQRAFGTSIRYIYQSQAI